MPQCPDDPMSDVLNIVVVEDNADLRFLIEEVLLQFGHQVRGVDTAEETDLLEDLDAVQLFILDLNLPGEDGLSLAQRLRARLPQAGIIILTACISPPDQTAGYEAGADIYLSKPIPPETLISAVNALGRRLAKTKAAKAAIPGPVRQVPWPEDLSPRLREVAELLVGTGLSHKQIAAQLQLSEGTVHRHVERLYRTLGVNSRAELTTHLNAS